MVEHSNLQPIMCDKIDFEKINALVFGDVILDRYIDGIASRLSPEKPVPVLKKTTTTNVLGGAGNVARNLIDLGASVRLVSCIGTDENGKTVCSLLDDLSIDWRYMICSPSRTTTVKTRITSGNHHYLRLDDEMITPIDNEISHEIISKIDSFLEGINVVVISDYSKGVVVKELTQQLIKRATLHSIPIVVDPKGTDWSKYNGSTICTPNYREFYSMFNYEVDTDDLDKMREMALDLIDSLNLQSLLITRSEKGMVLVTPENMVSLDAICKNAIDVSGAGDTVVSVMAACIARGFDLPTCCQLANEAASIVVSKPKTSTINITELLSFHDSKTKIVDFNSLIKISQQLHSEKKKIVMTNGCFDLLHSGHIKSLELARSMGDVLIVALNSDKSVKKLKGSDRPIIPQKDRACVLQALSSVDYIVIFDDETPISLIEKI